MPEKNPKTFQTINAVRKEVEAALKQTLNDEGTIDILQLREKNKPLAEIFDIITLSKTWRDDPKPFAKEVARLIAARDTTNDLAIALKNLEAKLKPSRKRG